MIRTPFIHIAVVVAFLVNTLLLPIAQADLFRLPLPGVMVHLSPPLDPPILKGIKVHPENPFRFDFILDKGDSQASDDLLKAESGKLIKYFLASLTMPEKDMWVNLSPYEKDRIIPKSFGLTEMGRDLLAEDYMLKQITASLIYPEEGVGKKFWKRIYEEAVRKYGTTNIQVNTFNKVWIIPDKAVVYENAKAGTAYVVTSTLKVMLEGDYLALAKNTSVITHSHDINAMGSQIVREIVIPELTTEVNQNKNFVRLRQVYNSLILATWYKNKIKDSILSQVYADKKKIAGISNDDPQETTKIYERYLQAFKRGTYNFIKEEQDPVTQEVIPRKYFSGGFNAAMLHIVPTTTRPEENQAQLVRIDAAMQVSRAGNSQSGSYTSAIGYLVNNLITNANKYGGKILLHYKEGSKAYEAYIEYFNEQHWVEGKEYVTITKDNIEKILDPVWQNEHIDDLKLYIADESIHFENEKTEIAMASVLGLPADDARTNMHDLAIAKIQSMEDKDHLTQTPTRLGAEKLFESLMKECAKQGYVHMLVSMMDIDYFKVINEVFGHDQGDIVLKEIAEIIRSTLREEYRARNKSKPTEGSVPKGRSKNRDIIARWGGEEFMWIKPFDQVDGEEGIDARHVLEKILKRIKDHVFQGLNNKEEIINKLRKADIKNEKIIYDALIFQLSLQNEGSSIKQLKDALPGLSDAIKAAEGKEISGYIFKRWIMTSSMGSVRVKATINDQQKKVMDRQWADAYLRSINKESDKKLKEAKDEGKNRVVIRTGPALNLSTELQFLTVNSILEGTEFYDSVKRKYPEGVNEIAITGTSGTIAAKIYDQIIGLDPKQGLALALTITDPRSFSLRYLLFVGSVADFKKNNRYQSERKIKRALIMKDVGDLDFVLGVDDDGQNLLNLDYFPESHSKRMEKVYRRLDSRLVNYFGGYGLIIASQEGPEKTLLDFLPDVKKNNKALVKLRNGVVVRIPEVSKAMKAATLNSPVNGGIDFTAGRMNLQTQNPNGEIKFLMNAAMLNQIKNAPGFVPVIINIQPMNDLKTFLTT
jgi:GGDEF domain-containing protein